MIYINLDGLKIKMAQPMDEKDVIIRSEGIPQIDPTEYTLRKRLPRRLPKRKNDVYINRKTNLKAQIARCQKMLDAGVPEIHIHGLGAAMNKAMTVALQLQKDCLGSVQLSVNTSTVELIDDLEPVKDELETESRERNNSAVHIKLLRNDSSDLQ